MPTFGSNTTTTPTHLYHSGAKSRRILSCQTARCGRPTQPVVSTMAMHGITTAATRSTSMTLGTPTLATLCSSNTSTSPCQPSPGRCTHLSCRQLNISHCRRYPTTQHDNGCHRQVKIANYNAIVCVCVCVLTWAPAREDLFAILGAFGPRCMDPPRLAS
jgi:hypothetical protein